MARYMETAREANKAITAIVESKAFGASDCVKADLVTQLGHLYNLGIKTCPRPCQTTVRFNAIQEAVKGLPVKVTKEEKFDESRQKTYNIIHITSTI